MQVVQAEPQPLDPVLGEQPLTYPDLQPDVQNIFVNTFVDELQFDTWSKNIGSVPLQVTLDGVSTETAMPTVSQCVSWYSPEDHHCREQVRVGGFTFHEVHGHFHFEEFATYTLRKTLADGTPDWSDAGIVAISEKVSFCLIDIENFDPSTGYDAYYTTANCLAPAYMGISPGWADNYDSTLDGQLFGTDNITDGRYAVVVDMDYANRLYETDDTNNRVIVTFTISGMGTDFPDVTNVQREWPTMGGGGTTTTTTTTSTTSTTTPCSSTTTSSTTSTTRRGNGGGGNSAGSRGNGGGNGKKCK